MLQRGLSAIADLLVCFKKECDVHWPSVTWFVCISKCRGNCGM